MNQPLGRMAGNAVEVNESVDALQGKGPADLMEVTLELGAELLVLAKRERRRSPPASSDWSARSPPAPAWRNSAKWSPPKAAISTRRGPSPRRAKSPARRAGFVTAIDTEALGHVIIDLGGGRKKLGDALDHSTGLEMLVRLGDRVEAGQPLVRVFAKPDAAARVKHELVAAITIGDDAVEPPALIVERIA